ncbi:MAG: hypothetical protein COZ96_06830 [Nitrospirae bacterium CG_4_8_14_3_um_filter_70_85]|nr:MAG: hypothetical protein COS73_00515 [Nitrospirae bacterium CG06_land_8_20_14_3_00_70_43]PIW82768.1 MAG: hypothetical protein COZ96_06830 [Nitrospirae bacterium CG_4_8_14_3_um_filter_70_85]PIX82308.1 MAG: hypothetical protein COZ33_11390 [Nitrospirae bacterium CG_4_10_14_3_um_filter_70_108]PJB95329.1 MAG: hypothetical protein CO080_08340 [Nitrospirae bacterium CG_4_9_14_0_8_um_filter_70_14]HBB40495.1 hypothetical protein [Pseudomonadota bacterium]
MARAHGWSHQHHRPRPGAHPGSPPSRPGGRCRLGPPPQPHPAAHGHPRDPTAHLRAQLDLPTERRRPWCISRSSKTRSTARWRRPSMSGHRGSDALINRMMKARERHNAGTVVGVVDDKVVCQLTYMRSDDSKFAFESFDLEWLEERLAAKEGLYGEFYWDFEERCFGEEDP